MLDGVDYNFAKVLGFFSIARCGGRLVFSLGSYLFQGTLVTGSRDPLRPAETKAGGSGAATAIRAALAQLGSRSNGLGFCGFRAWGLSLRV